MNELIEGLKGSNDILLKYFEKNMEPKKSNIEEKVIALEEQIIHIRNYFVQRLKTRPILVPTADGFPVA